jgi:hypothetical protein
MKAYFAPEAGSRLESYLAEVEGSFISVDETQAINSKPGTLQALECIERGEKVVLTGFTPRYRLAMDYCFHAALSAEGVQFVELPLSLEGIREVFATAQPAGPVRDQTAQALIECMGLRPGSLDGGLKHDLKYARQGRNTEEWRQKAVRRFGDLPLEELYKLVEETPAGDPSFAPLRGQSFQDIFVDVEGTLLYQNGVLNQALIEQNTARAEAEGRYVTVWTGAGEIEKLAMALGRLGIPWKVASKYWFAGANVAIAYDDLSREDFDRTYGVGVDTYIQV